MLLEIFRDIMAVRLCFLILVLPDFLGVHTTLPETTQRYRPRSWKKDHRGSRSPWHGSGASRYGFPQMFSCSTQNSKTENTIPGYSRVLMFVSSWRSNNLGYRTGSWISRRPSFNDPAGQLMPHCPKTQVAAPSLQ